MQIASATHRAHRLARPAAVGLRRLTAIHRHGGCLAVAGVALHDNLRIPSTSASGNGAMLTVLPWFPPSTLTCVDVAPA